MQIDQKGVEQPFCSKHLFERIRANQKVCPEGDDDQDHQGIPQDGPPP